MAVLAAVWVGLVADGLVATSDLIPTLTVVGNLIWAIFAVELLAKLIVSGHPGRFLVRRWPSVFFLLAMTGVVVVFASVAAPLGAFFIGVAPRTRGARGRGVVTRERHRPETSAPVGSVDRAADVEREPPH